MAARAGWEQEPAFGDALAGSGGMSDPVQPTYSSSSSAADLFPDALSATPLPGIPLPMLPSGPLDSSPAVPAAGARRGSSRLPPPAPGQRPWSQFPPPGQPGPARAGQARPVPVGLIPAGPAAVGPRPGQQYVPVPTSAQLAPALAAGSGRRPTAGTGYRGVGPAPSSAPGGQIRPPAYLPQGQGLAQVRSAIGQARAASAGRSAAAATSARKRTGIWGFLVLLGILLVTSGAAHRIITTISELLQRR